MKQKYFAIAFIGVLVSCLQSCNKERMEPMPASTPVTSLSAPNPHQIAFAKMLAKGVKADPALRRFLRTEALKMFNKDYDILYHMVKDQPIENGETFGQRLTRYADSGNDLANIERQVPSLTIFVPSLPSGFSAETWDVANEVPVIAVRKLDDSKVPFYDDKGTEHVLQPYETPGFPVLVIKQNERVQVTGGGITASKGDQPVFYQNQQFSFSFSSPEFDGIRKSPQPASRIAVEPGYDYDEKIIGRPVISAFQFTQTNTTLWQRDHIYYSISPTRDRGELRTNFRETIRSFRLSTAGINLIANHPATPTDSDPRNPRVGDTQSRTSAWTDGYFEFQIIVLYNAKDGTGAQLSVDFGARPLDLYDMTFKRGGWPWYNYTITSVTPKEFFPSISIAAWDLQNFGTAWKYHIYERNTDVNVETTSTVSTTYANNFEVSAEGTIFKVVKVGGKYGSKTENTSTRSVKLTYKQGSADLGEKVSYFYDPIIVSKGTTWYGGDSYTTYELAPGGTAGYVFLSVEPWSVVQNDNYY